MPESGFPARWPGKDEVARLRLGKPFDDGERGIGKGNAMLARRLHSVSGNRPDFSGKVEFWPSRPKRLARSRRRQDRKFERHRGQGVPLAQTRDESRNVIIGHRGMMAARELAALRQQVGKMAAPCRRVFARPMALRLGRVENRLDASAQSGCGFRFRLPQGRQDGENRPCVDFIDRTRRATARHSFRASCAIAPDVSRCAIRFPSRQ